MHDICQCHKLKSFGLLCYNNSNLFKLSLQREGLFGYQPQNNHKNKKIQHANFCDKKREQKEETFLFWPVILPLLFILTNSSMWFVGKGQSTFWSMTVWKSNKRFKFYFTLSFFLLWTKFVFSCFHRRWVRLGRKEKGTTSTSGQFTVRDPCGSARRPSASVTKPQTFCCRSQGSSTGGPSTVRWRSMAWRAPVSTACGRPWRESSWSPAKSQQAAKTTVTHTQSFEPCCSFSCPVSSWFPFFLLLCD